MVAPRGPAHRSAPRATPRPSRVRRRVVGLAARAPSPRSTLAPEAKIATVMLRTRRDAGLRPARQADRRLPRGILQRALPRRVPRHASVLVRRGRQDQDRGLEAGLQREPASQCPGAPDAPRVCCPNDPKGSLMKPGNSPTGRASFRYTVRGVPVFFDMASRPGPAGRYVPSRGSGETPHRRAVSRTFPCEKVEQRTHGRQ